MKKNLMSEKARKLTSQLNRERKTFQRSFERTDLPLEMYRDYVLFADIRFLFKIESTLLGDAASIGRPLSVLECLQKEISPTFECVAELSQRLKIQVEPSLRTPLRYLRTFDPYSLNVPYNDLAGEFAWVLEQTPSPEVLFAFRSLVHLNFLFFHNLLHSIFIPLLPPPAPTDAIDYAIFIESLVCISEEHAIQQMGPVLYDLLKRFGLFFDFGDIEKTSLYDSSFPKRLLKQLRHRHATPSEYAKMWYPSYAEKKYPSRTMAKHRIDSKLKPFELEEFALVGLEQIPAARLEQLFKWQKSLLKL